MPRLSGRRAGRRHSGALQARAPGGATALLPFSAHLQPRARRRRAWIGARRSPEECAARVEMRLLLVPWAAPRGRRLPPSLGDRRVRARGTCRRGQGGRAGWRAGWGAGAGGYQRGRYLAPGLVCLGLNRALCVLINLEAQVTTSLAVRALRNAKSKRQLRRKRMPILFSAGLNWLFRLNLIGGNAGETESQACPGCLRPGSAPGGEGCGANSQLSGLSGHTLQSTAGALACATDHTGSGDAFPPFSEYCYSIPKIQ